MSKSKALTGNIVANYVSQLYVAVIGIVMVPLYLAYMGAEAYGLVGFFAVLQAWLTLLDMGLTPTVTRETARFHGGATGVLDYRRLVHALEILFLVIAVVGGGAIFVSSGYIASNWLQAAQLPITEVQTAVQLMAGIVALRWMCGLYRGTIGGSEQLIWLGWYNALIATLRFIGVFIVLEYVGVTPTVFFSYQLGVAVLELLGLLVQARRLLPAIPEGARIDWSWAPLKSVLKFSSSIAFITLVWVLITQTDKLILSKILPLAEYGYFTLAALVASGLMVISGPVSGAVMPRMVKLEAEGDHAGMIQIYRQATQLVAVVAGAITITLVFCAEPLLWAWTGDKVLAQQTAPILVLYALGNGIVTVSGFPYLLQYTKGDLKLHLIGNAGFVVLLMPSIIWAASEYGAMGTGYVWLVMNLIAFVVWVPIVHHKLEPGLNLKWYLEDVLIILLAASVVGYWLSSIVPYSDSRGAQLMILMGVGLLILLAAASASSVFRARAAIMVRSRK